MKPARSLAIRCVRSAHRARMAMDYRLWHARLGALGAGTTISPQARIYVPRAVRLGSAVSINDFVHIWGGGGVTIGDASLIAAHAVITSQTHDIDAVAKGLLYRDTNVNAEVVIGSNVWIGSGACVLPGVTVGDDSVIGAGAVVTRDVPARSVAVGVPARIVRSL